ncbi:MAG: hypothetical protein AB4290_10245 [Spirulina sp.]
MSFDELVFTETGKHLDDLQLAILKGVLKGHVKDEGYELWKILSEILGEDLNKFNFRATIERLGITNSILFENSGSIRDINFCPPSPENKNISEIENLDDVDTENSTQFANNESKAVDNLQHEIQLRNIPKLVKLGLTAEQIAEALDLPLTEVQQEIR